MGFDYDRGGNWNIPTSYDYDAISRLGILTHGFATTGYNTTNTLSYNPASQLAGVAKSNDAYAWSGYVAVNRAYAKNGLNQYTSAGGASFSYDANGNLTSDGSNGYQYDVENRLVANTVTGASVSYDPLGRMWQSYGGAQGYTRYLYDGDQLVAEYDVSGTMTNRYVHSDGEDDPLVWYAGSSTSSPKYLYADQQGSIVAIADDGGVTTNVNAYDEYGIPKSGNAGRFQYTGQAWLPELGMYYYKARFYSPTLGRFLQTDPIGYKDQINLYAYVGNDPIDGRDPSGNDSLWERAGQAAIGVAEVAVGAVGTVVGAAGDAASAGLEVASAGLGTPIAAPGAAVSTVVVAGSVALATDGANRLSGAILNNRSTDPNARDRQRVSDQRDRRAGRREDSSRQGPNGNGQTRSGEGARYQGRQNANKPGGGEKPADTTRGGGRERNVGHPDGEEHSMREKGQQRY